MADSWLTNALTWVYKLRRDESVRTEEGIRERIVSFEVDDLQMHSDHCPLLLKLIIGTAIITGVRRQGYHQGF